MGEDSLSSMLCSEIVKALQCGFGCIICVVGHGNQQLYIYIQPLNMKVIADPYQTTLKCTISFFVHQKLFTTSYST